MKKFFILASAAIVALASCAKTEVVYKDAPEEIAFKTVNMPMTKAAYTQDLGVAAYYLSDKSEYFGKTRFTLHSGVWTGGQFWPLANPLVFAAYGPYEAGAVSMAQTGITAVGVPAETDLVYSYVDNGGAGYTKKAFESTGVHLELKHTKSKVVVHVSTGTNETVTAVELLNTGTSGDCAVTFTGDVVSWTNANSVTVDFTTDTEHLVIPSTPTILKITYDSTSPAQTGLTVSIDLSTQTMKDASDNVITETDWQPGYSYTYHININSNQINIHATEAPWVEADND